jgi:hypothetical protein
MKNRRNDDVNLALCLISFHLERGRVLCIASQKEIPHAPDDAALPYLPAMA